MFSLVSDNIRPSSSFLQWLRDEPPPYPGKYSRTNVNYLPSYLSAIEMEQERQRQETATMSQPARDLPEVSSQSSVIMFTAPEDGVVCLKDSRNSDSQIFSQSRVNETSTTVENVINEVLIANQRDEEDAQLEENRLRAPTAMDITPAVDNRVTLDWDKTVVVGTFNTTVIQLEKNLIGTVVSVACTKVVIVMNVRRL